MTVAELNGISLGYREHGSGPPVLMLMGTGSPGRVWELHQVPALVAAGYRAVTVDARGIPPSSECAGGITIDDLVADAAALLEHLGGEPTAVVGTSLGARVAQELALARPDLVSRVACLAAHGRPHPVTRMLNAGERALHDTGTVLPPEFHAAVTALLNLSTRTLADPAVATDWLDLFAFSGSAIGAGARAQLDLDEFPDRLADYRAMRVPLLAMAFAEDRIIPPFLVREVADAVPGARFVEIADCGHFGYLERPAEVNRVLLEFLAEST
ncbi:MAG: alpha/beta hydrolase [Pseudonocardia sp. SCN 72-86]|nr:MAG: alpha/beta hydrolase [Pseudonocardia sp. SCN 72-86]